MKKVYSYKIISLMFILCMSVFNMNTFGEDIRQTGDSSHFNINEQEAVAKNLYITNFNTLLSLTGTYGNSPSAQSAGYSNVHLVDDSLRVSFCSHKTNQELCNIKLQYFLFCSEKQTNGYYLFSIRKLQI